MEYENVTDANSGFEEMACRSYQPLIEGASAAGPESGGCGRRQARERDRVR